MSATGNSVEIRLRVDRKQLQTGLAQAEAEVKKSTDRIRQVATPRSRQQGAFALLGIRSEREISTELRRVEAAYKRLAASGRASQGELARASAAAADKVARLRAELHGTTRAMDAQAGQSARLARGLQRVNGVAVSLAGRLGAVAAGYLTIRSAVAGVQAVLSTGANFEKLGIQLEAVAGGARQGAEALAFIQNFTARTPLQLQEVTDAFVRLKAFGLDPTDGTLQAIADQSAKLGGSQETLSGIVLALGQAYAKQKLQGEEILQLVERGVPVWDLLAQATGRTTAELQEMSSAGQLGRDVIRQLIAAMGAGAVGAAEAQMATFNGQVSNLRDNWTRFLDLVARSGTLEFFKQQIESINAAFAEMERTGELQQIARDVSDAIVGMAKTIQTLGETVIAAAPAFTLLLELAVGLKLARAVRELQQLSLASAGLGSALRSAVGPAGALRQALGGLIVVETAVQVAKLGLAMREYDQATFSATESQRAQQRSLIGVIDQARDYAGTVVLTREAIAGLSKAELQGYRERLAASRDFYRAQRDLSALSLGPEAAAADPATVRAQREAVARTRALAEVDRALQAQLQREEGYARTREQLAVQLAAEEKKLRELEDQADKASIEQRKRNQRELLAEKQTAAREGLAAVKSALAEAEKAEADYTRRIQELRGQQEDDRQSIEERIRERRRSQLSPEDQQRDIEREAATRINQARDALRSGDTEAVRDLANDAGSLSDRLADVDRGVAILQEVGRLLDAAAEQEVAAAERARAAQRERIGELEQLAQQGAGALSAITAELQAIDNVDPTIEIRDNIDQVLTRVEKLKKALASLDGAGAGASVGLFGLGGAVRRARGGAIPGYGGGDRVPALLEAGEYVIRKEAVRTLGLSALHDLNARVAPRLPHIPRFREGGLVGTGEAVAAALPAGVVRHEIVIGGRKHSDIFAASDRMDQLVDDLRRVVVLGG